MHTALMLNVYRELQRSKVTKRKRESFYVERNQIAIMSVVALPLDP